MEAALRDLGVAESTLVDARAEFIRFTVSDLGNSAIGSPNIPMKLGEDAVREWKEIHGKRLDKSPDEIEEFLRRWGVLTPKRMMRVDDMRWLISHGDIRDREQYLRAHETVEWNSPD